MITSFVQLCLALIHRRPFTVSQFFSLNAMLACLLLMNIKWNQIGPEKNEIRCCLKRAAKLKSKTKTMLMNTSMKLED